MRNGASAEKVEAALGDFRSKFNPVFAVEAQGFCPLPTVKEVAAEAASKFHQ